MKLMRITAQSGEDLRRFYDVQGWETKNERWRKPITAMLELLDYLELEVDFPPQWVLTSHANLVFVGADDYRERLVTICPLGECTSGPRTSRFEIHRPLEAPWSDAVGYAPSVQSAWKMIESVLCFAPVPHRDAQRGFRA